MKYLIDSVDLLMNYWVKDPLTDRLANGPTNSPKSLKGALGRKQADTSATRCGCGKIATFRFGNLPQELFGYELIN